MVHNHGGHDQGHSHAPPSNHLAFAVGVTLNVAFVVIEVIYGIAAQSLALLADAGVSLGVVVAGFAIVATGWHWIDPAASILIGIVIVVATWGLLRESVNLAMDAVPAGIDPDAVKIHLSGLPGVTAVHDLHIWGMSTTETALTVHLVMPQPPPNDKFLQEVCHKLHKQFEIGHTTVQIEHGDVDVTCENRRTWCRVGTEMRRRGATGKPRRISTTRGSGMDGDNLNMSSTWLCSRNDLIANVGVLVAAAATYLLSSRWPDIVVGAVIATLFLNSAVSVLHQSVTAPRSAGSGEGTLKGVI